MGRGYWEARRSPRVEREVVGAEKEVGGGREVVGVEKVVEEDKEKELTAVERGMTGEVEETEG